MPLRVHAVVVTRHSATSHARLLRTLEALGAQSQPADAITLVVCGDASAARTSPTVAATVEAVIQTRPGERFAGALALAYPRIAPDHAIWVLDDDCAPHPDALRNLSGALERAPMAAAAAPKLVTASDPADIVSLGVSMTRYGRTVEHAGGEIDQGQHDGREDTLGADIRGMLIRAELRDALTLDPALGVADLGLDLGVRSRLAGGRLVLAPRARLVVTDNGPAALPRRPALRTYATRRAQLHRRLTYAAAPLVPLHWLSLLPLALWRMVLHLVGKQPASVLPEVAAALVTFVQVPSVVRARSRIRRFRRAGWSTIEPLRVDRAQLRQRLDDGHGSEQGARNDLRFFTGGGAWAVLTALVVGIGMFASTLAWPAIGGGALLPLRDTLAGLWRDAGWGLRGIGVDVVGPADPFAGVLAVLGSLWPAAPSYILVLLWLLALPLAMLGGWFAATRMTERAGLRILGGVLWALAPTFLTALVQGRPAAVIVHLLLPWLLHSAAVAHRSWGAAGAASILLIGVAASAPSLVPALLVIWVLALVLTAAHGRARGVLRLLWLPIPAAVVFAPLVWWRIRHGDLWALLADPGAVWAGPQATADAAGRALLAMGFPSADLAGWAGLVGDRPLWAPLLIAPVALLALAAALSPRWPVGIGLLVVASAGLGSAFLAVGIFVSFSFGAPVAIWPGTGLSLAWLGVAFAALVTLDASPAPDRLRGLAAALVGIAVIVCAVPALTAQARGETEVRNGPTSTLPAFVVADTRGDLPRATLVLTPLDEAELAARVVWGSSETLGGQSTLVTTATEPIGTDVTELAVRLISAQSFDDADELAALGIRYLLLMPTADESEQARELRLSAASALSQRSGLVRVGETEKGTLWRTATDEVAPAPAEDPIAGRILTVTLLTLLAALLLALPTRASRRAARAHSRVLAAPKEER